MNYKWVKGIQQALEFRCLGLNPSLAVYLLCDLGQVIQPLCVCFVFTFLRRDPATQMAWNHCGDQADLELEILLLLPPKHS